MKFIRAHEADPEAVASGLLLPWRRDARGEMWYVDGGDLGVKDRPLVGQTQEPKTFWQKLKSFFLGE